MRIVELRLSAFGPFSGARLDFSTPSPGLHVVFGPNEAGKSTALRAITGLLYGIPRDTHDDHLHRKPELRIGARLEGGGLALDVVRRKGMHGTLLAPNGEPIDDAPLKRMLGGIGEEVFRAMFGLDHGALRRGAQALLEGRGHMGESLFGAALGAGLHDVLGRLREEADRLFTPQAHKRPVNEALKAFAEAQKRSRQALTESTWTMQEETLQAALASQTRLDEEKRESKLRHARINRARQLVPLLAEHRTLVERRDALGEVPLLPDSARADREAAERDSEQAAQAVDALERSIGEVERSLAELRVPELLASLDDETVGELQGWLAKYRAASAELPAALAELAALEREAEELERRLGGRGSRDERLDASGEARIRRLALDRAGLDAGLLHADETLSELDERHAALLARRAAIAAPPPRPELEAAVSAARSAGDLEQRLRRLEAERERLETAARAKLAALGSWTGSEDQARALPLPPVESIDAMAATWSRLAAEADEVATETAVAEREASERERDIAELQRGGSAPTEEDLVAIRARRDDAWSSIRGALVEGESLNDEDATGFERAMADADIVADRLRREADRVARQARLLADRDAMARRREQMAERAADVEARWSAARATWADLWKPAGIDPLPPVEMRAWCARHAALVLALEQRDGAKTEREAIASELAANRSALGKALEAAEGAARDDESLGAMLARATQRLGDDAENQRQARELEAAAAETAERRGAAKRQSDRRRQAMDEWMRAWSVAIRPLGLDADASVDEATAVLEASAELARVIGAAAALRRRTDAMTRDVAAFEAEIAALLERYLPALSGMPPDTGASRLLKAHKEARAALAEKTHRDALLAKEKSVLAEQRERLERLRNRLTEMMAAAGARDLPELARVEERASEARGLDLRIAALEEQLVRAGGASVSALEAEVEGLRQTDLAAELDEVEERLAQIDDELLKVNREIGSIEKGFERLERSDAAEAASEAQQHLARARSYVERYLRVKLAALLLEREIERYREKAQGPVLTRASELVARLTLGSVPALRVGYGDDDAPLLFCVRADGSEVDVTGLSEGTRDQLYLALRLATLERYATFAEPMPLVADDLFIQFDDDRARAGFAVLGELARTTQVLFFTHHARLVDLAREAVPQDRFAEHRLERTAASAPIEPASDPPRYAAESTENR